MSPAPPILVTGMVRSGTTWIGRMLAAGGESVYVSEPLNKWDPGIFRLGIERDYTYLHAGNDAHFLSVLGQEVQLRPHLLRELSRVRTPTDAGRAGLRAGQLAWGRMRGRSVLFKDPYAVFSAEWFADRLGCRVVVVVRSPGGVISSLKRLNWRAPLADLSAQPALVRDWLEPYRADLDAAMDEARLRRDVVWSNAVLWRLVYSTVAAYAERRPDFLIVRHEDLSRDPEGAYARLYEELGMPFEERVAAAVRATSDPGNPEEIPVDRPHSVRLDSRVNLGNWRHRLSAAEVEMIRALTEPVGSRWYPDGDWD